MQAAIAPRGDARTYLIHFVGGGLEDDRYVVECYVSKADGEIVPVQSGGTARKSWRKARGTVDRPGRLDVLPARRGPPLAWPSPAVFHPPTRSSR